ncbi:glycosyltransferase family 2 protein [Companilactobacillus pabuli]|uniref:Glycosyltransferase family 2 protein n=1 Tax=Companilactobacillus pabuli TaxID=2714036 RepID=A0A7L7L0X8_9LACO|nr:glycosyltransferase family A protein [Companilactobacillus pabuli]QMT85456.1 glycosyltransferase family 2 protein [Companilactobacillus pabuli]
MDNKISVVIRTYNEEKHIGEVLESLQKQTYKNYEIVIVDSGSTDGTVEILKKFDTKLVFIEKKNLIIAMQVTSV